MAQGDIYYFGKIGKEEYNTSNKEYTLEPSSTCLEERIILMGQQIGMSQSIKKGDNLNEYIETIGEVIVKYKYINGGEDLEIDWEYKAVEDKEEEKEEPKFEKNIKNVDNTSYTYLDKDGNKVIKKWEISEENFLDYMELSYEQIKNICSVKNKGLIEKGFDVAIFNCSQQLKINARVILATLAQEQGWCKNGKYEKAFGVGPGGTPKTFSDFEKGGIFKSVNTYIKWFNIGKKNNGKELHVNLDKSPYKETNAVFQDKTKAWQKSNQKYVKYMEEGIKIIPVNAVMYAKLKYTPWIDFHLKILNLYNSGMIFI